MCMDSAENFVLQFEGALQHKRWKRHTVLDFVPLMSYLISKGKEKGVAGCTNLKIHCQ